MQRYEVRVSGDDLVFSAGHFITYGGNVCERLHGHTYRVAAEVRGTLDDDYCVIDFLALRQALRAILDELDHRMLLPTGHASIQVTADDTEVLVRFQDRRWIFPRADCVLLCVPNTTAELLARFFAERLQRHLRERLSIRPQSVRVEVHESYGQSAVCELSGEPGDL